MKKQQKLVMAIHDLSGFGRSSLSVIIPTMSVMGIQVCSVPTAVLSSHTGGLGKPEFIDLSNYLDPALEHYKTLNLTVDSIYTGFVSSSQQIDSCKAYLEAYPNSIKLVDPVMGDGGKAYSTINAQIQSKMRELVAMADIITPNLTEACILLGEDYPKTQYSLDYCIDILKRLSELGAKEVILKGLLVKQGKISNLLYNKNTDNIYISEANLIPQSYPGTGDIFASVYLGGILNGDLPQNALDRCCKFLEFAVGYTYKLKTDTRYGIAIEECLSWFFSKANL